jgi:hypothetical protein
MSNFDTLFITQFETEVFEAFQHKGGTLRTRGRRKTGVTGNECRFPKVDLAGAAKPKTKGGKVPLLDILRDKVTATLTDYYGADQLDSLDELKTNVDQRGISRDAIVMSLARSEDDVSTAALITGSNAADNTATNDSFTTDAIPRLMLETFGEGNAFAGGKMHALISWKAWSDLLAVDSFVNSEYGGDNLLTSEGQRPKMYFGFDYAPFSRLPEFSSGVPYNIWWHHDVLGIAVGAEISSTMERLPDYDAWFIMGKMSQGAVLIEDAGVVKRRYGG